MSSKVKRKVTVENSKESEQPRRPSVFERLGPGALNLPSQSQDRHNRVDHNEKCRNWLRTGNCTYGNTCRYQHNPYSVPSKRVVKGDKEIDEKDLRHKVRKQRDDPKESRTGSASPKRQGSKRSGSRSRKGEHESKIKSTVVVTRPRSPPAPPAPSEPTEKEKKKPEGSWEDDSDDWPMDAAQLDYKEELTLERKRQQLQRELELELQKERMMNENVSFSESSSTSSSSDSGSISSSSDSSTSSSDDDSDESSSSSSSSSSSASQAPPKKKYKKPTSKKESIVTKPSEAVLHKKALDDYDKIKSSRAAKSASARIHSPVSHDTGKKKGRDRKNASPVPAVSPKSRSTHDSSAKSGSHHVRKGPRTPSPPPPSRKQRQWGQSSSADSRSADVRRNRGKRHKKKKDASRTDRYKNDYVPTPPRLSSPNRTALQPHGQIGKKSWQRDDLGSKSHHRSKDHSPLLLSRLSGPSNNSPLDRHAGGSFYTDMDKSADKHNKSKSHGRKSEENFQKKGNNRDHSSKRSRLSPVKPPRHDSLSPHYDRYETDQSSKKVYSSSFLPPEKDEKSRRRSVSPARRGKDNKDRKKSSVDTDKRRDNRDISPRPHDNRKDSHYRGSDQHTYKKEEPRVKRLLSPDIKKTRDDKVKDRGQKERPMDQDNWNEDHKKNVRLSDSRNSRLDPPISQSSASARNDRSRDRERDRKKGKDREPPPLRDELERDRPRLTPPLRGAPDIHPHHALRDEPPVPVPRSHIYEADLPPDDREYAYGYGPHHEPPYIDDRVLPPEYEADLLQVPPLYPPPDAAEYPPVVYSDARYRRDVALKDPPHMERIVGYGGREVSPLDPREPVVLPVREEDYLADLPIDERRAYDERWGRNRSLRDEWDPYPPLTPTALPPHVTASLDEDRYGMPRRRRASPDWHMRRGNERDLPLREPRSRSPQHRRMDDVPIPGRPPWRDPNDRHGNRTNDNRSDNQQKQNQDDRKGRMGRRDRRDRNKRSDDHPSEPPKPSATSSKEKTSLKRSRSSSPPRSNKKRKEDTSKDDTASSEKVASSSRKSRDEIKSDTKSSSGTKPATKAKNCFMLPHTQLSASMWDVMLAAEFMPQKETKQVSGRTKSLSPKADEKQSADKPASSKTSDKSDVSGKSNSKSSSKQDGDEKRKRNNNDGKSQVDDEFSDWSDGDDDLLNRDPIDSESTNGERSRNRSDDHKKDKQSTDLSETSKDGKDRGSKQKRDSSRDSRIRTHELRSESRSRTGSKERISSESSRKQEAPVPSAKESDSSEAFVVKDEAVEDLDDFMMTESVDYDPISDGELEALIEEPDDSLPKPAETSDDSKIVDALDVNWSALLSDQKPKFIPGNARKRFKAAHVLARIGFSQAFAGAELSEKIMKFCQQQLDEEKKEEEAKAESTSGEKPSSEKFQMEHPIASFHVLLTQRKKERQNAFYNVGPNRRALCARQDLEIRKLLCRPSNKPLVVNPSTCVQQYGSTDSEQELKKIDSQPPVINASC